MSHDSQQFSPAWKGYFERYAAPILARDRFFLGMVLALAAAVAEGFALAALVPLHSMVPYVIQVDTTGRVVSSGVVAPSIGQPTSAELAYWIGKWVSDLFTVDPAYTRDNLRSAYLFTDGPAVGQMKAFLTSQDSPLAQMEANPDLRVQVKVKTVRAIGQNESYVVAEVKNLLTGKTSERDVTLTYRLQPAKTVEAAMLNPLGLRITNFSIDGGP